MGCICGRRSKKSEVVFSDIPQFWSTPAERVGKYPSRSGSRSSANITDDTDSSVHSSDVDHEIRTYDEWQIKQNPNHRLMEIQKRNRALSQPVIYYPGAPRNDKQELEEHLEEIKQGNRTRKTDSNNKEILSSLKTSPASTPGGKRASLLDEAKRVEKVQKQQTLAKQKLYVYLKETRRLSPAVEEF